MALLNFANTYAEISGNLTLPQSNTGDYVKLFFSKDGHIISHGKDFTPTFTPSERGLVPQSSGKSGEFLRGNATWAAITTADLPIAISVADAIANGITTTTLLNTQQIIEYVSEQFSANDAMRFKGSIKWTGSGYETTTEEGTTSGFPTVCEVGDTYRIGSQGTYGGQTCVIGDILLCIKDGSGSINTSEYWTAIEANINGTITHSVNGKNYKVYSPNINPDLDRFTIYAPTVGGNVGQVLLGNGNDSPVWANQADLVAGEAKKTTYALSVGTGLTFETQSVTFNGSAARTISLMPATTSSLGGVIVDKDNTNKTISVSNGNIYLTKENIINALGYTPGDALKTSLYYLYLGNDGDTSNSTTPVVNPFINLYGTAGADTSIQVKGDGHTTVSGINGVINVSSTWRTIKVAGTSIGDKALNFMPTGDVYVKVGDQIADTDDYDISFGLSWYNISDNAYEYE